MILVMLSSVAWADDVHAHWAGAVECAIVHAAECGVFFGAAVELDSVELHVGVGPVLALEEEAEVGAGIHTHTRFKLTDRWSLATGAGLHLSEHLGAELSLGALITVTATSAIGPALQLRLHEPESALWHERVLVPQVRWRYGFGHDVAVTVNVGGAYYGAADIKTGIVENLWTPAFGLGFETHF